MVLFTGERLDFVDYDWVDSAPRPYDPPLTRNGERQARENAEKFKDKVSPLYPHYLSLSTMHALSTV